MELCYYKTFKGNFGDDLNAWLWPKIFQIEEIRNIQFLGIGSILSEDVDLINKLDSSKTKVVFGTGARFSYKKFQLVDSWDVLFLRGPLSSKYFNDKYNFISDGAYCLKQVEGFESYMNLPKKYEVSFMPHVSSVGFFNWKKICEYLGMNYISPHSEKGVEFTLKEIAQSKRIISEAMHGAIIADVYRVPWHRMIFSTPYFEGALISEFKWNDWLLSVGINNNIPTYVKAYFKSPINPFLHKITGHRLDVHFFIKNHIRPHLYKSLVSINKFHLSSDKKILNIDKKLVEKIDYFKSNYQL